MASVSLGRLNIDAAIVTIGGAWIWVLGTDTRVYTDGINGAI
jgi:hypothetical protein